MIFPGQNCQILDYMTGVAHNLYDLQRYEDWLIYSDWGDHKVKVVSMVTGQESVVMEGLMRPSQFHLLVTSALGENVVALWYNAHQIKRLQFL